MLHESKLVVGVTRLQSRNDSELQPYRHYFKHLGFNVPVLEADPRSRHDVIVLIRAALANAQFGRIS